ncbi:hypothetical protein KXV85_002809, partial [Aspergillus fumigatus]
RRERDAHGGELVPVPAVVNAGFASAGLLLRRVRLAGKIGFALLFEHLAELRVAAGGVFAGLGHLRRGNVEVAVSGETVQSVRGGLKARHFGLTLLPVSGDNRPPFESRDVTVSDLATLEKSILDQIAAASDEPALEAVRVAALGKKGSISALLATLGKMSPDERKTQGAAINLAKDK